MGAPLLEDLADYERKALEMGISLHGGSVVQPGVSSSTRDFKRWLKGVWRWSISLYGSSVKGTWREGSLVGDCEG